MENIFFDKLGLPQPPGVHKVNKYKWETFFANIENKDIRIQLLLKWQKHISDFKNIVQPNEWKQWIGGGYTTMKVDPKDIDVVNIIDYESLNEMLGAPGPYFSSLEPSNDSRLVYNIDSYHVAIFPQNDPRYKIMVKEIKYWEKWFGKDRDGNQRAIFEVTI